MSLPLVSVCILTFNHAQYISDCIMSAVSQVSDVSLEILVGDDCSDDGTSDIVHSMVQRFPGLISHIRHQTRQAGKNYQYLVGLASGKYIAHLDGDDYWLPGKLIRQVKILEESPEVTACYTNALCVNEAEELVGFFNNRQPQSIDLDYLLRRGNFLNNSTTVYRAKYKQFFIDRPANYLDYTIHLVMAQHGKLAYLNIFGTGYRVSTATSLIRNHGEFVREMYWRAICEVPVNMVASDSKLWAEADFLRRVFFRSLRIADLGLVGRWWITISSNSRSKGRLFLMSAIAVLAVGSRELLEVGLRRLNKSFIRIVYWR